MTVWRMSVEILKCLGYVSSHICWKQSALLDCLDNKRFCAKAGLRLANSHSLIKHRQPPRSSSNSVSSQTLRPCFLTMQWYSGKDSVIKQKRPYCTLLDLSFTHRSLCFWYPRGKIRRHGTHKRTAEFLDLVVIHKMAEAETLEDSLGNGGCLRDRA